MYLNAPKLSLLSAVIIASIGAVYMPAEVRAGETTLSTVITGSDYPTKYGYRKLVAKPNPNERVVRTLDDGAAPTNLTDSFPLLAFGHMSDTQICDDQSPARTPFMDKRADIDPTWLSDAAYRPQERLTAQMATAMVSSLRNVDKAPQTGLPLAFTLITGDMVDNAQYNETRTYIDLMDGGNIRPNHWLDPAVEEGPGYGGNNTRHKYNTFDWPGYLLMPSAYYHPNATGEGNPDAPPDWYRQRDFPVIPYLLSASRRNFMSPGLGMPWYAAFGNHDMSIQGNLPLEDDDYFELGQKLKGMATASDRITDVSLPWNMPEDKADWAGAILDDILDPVDTASATRDPNRMLLTKTEFMEEHFATTGLPVGHGFDGKPYYVIPSSGPNDRFKFIALDTTNRTEFGADGWLDSQQFEWLMKELKSASTRWWSGGVNGDWVVNPDPAAKDKLIVLYGHHTLQSMNKVSKNADGSTRGISGYMLADQLKNFPNVIMYVNGHTHSNRIQAHPITHTVNGKEYKSGFWEVTSPAAADFPVQSRLIEIALATTGDRNESQNNNYISIYTTMLDVDAPPEVDRNGTFLTWGGLGDYHQLASIGRELAFNDVGDLFGGKERGWRAGVASDRNTRLILPTPFPMNDFPRPATTWYGVHIVTQKADTKDAKILVMKSDGGYSGTAVDFAGSSLQDSEVIGTGNFWFNANGQFDGNDLVLRDSAGNIRIKLLDREMNEVAYPGFGAHVRGSVASDTELSGIADMDLDGKDELIWRHSDGTVEVWPAGSVVDRKYLNYANDFSNSTPDAGSEHWKIVAVGDFNGDGSPDMLWENMSDPTRELHSRVIRYFNGFTHTSDAPATNESKYSWGYDLQPGVGHSALLNVGEHLLTRKMRLLNGTPSDRAVTIYDPDGVGQPVFYQNKWGWNAGADWKPQALGDFNRDGVHDILWRQDGGYFAIWWLGATSSPYLGDYGFNAVGPEWVVKGVLKNEVATIY